MYYIMCKQCGRLYEYYGIYDDSSFSKFCSRDCAISNDIDVKSVHDVDIIKKSSHNDSDEINFAKEIGDAVSIIYQMQLSYINLNQ